MSDINSDISETMLSAAHELSLYIAEANQELRKKVHSQTETEPDWHDTQTCYELAQDAKRVIAMQGRIVELEGALKVLLNAAIDYVEYKHDGDPYMEDARAMNEMELDDLNNNGTLVSIKDLLKDNS